MKRVYLCLPEKGVLVKTQEAGKKMIQDLEMIIERVECEKDTKLYYSGENLNAFFAELDCAQGIEEISFGGYDIRTSLSVMLERSEDWEVESYAKSSEIYALWDANSRQVTNASTLLQEISAASDDTNNSLIIKILPFEFSFNYDTSKPFIPLVKDKWGDEKYPILCRVFFVNDFKSLEIWLQERQGERNLNITDERHQEWSPKSKKMSPLLYDLRNEKDCDLVRKLLETAITDKRDGERTSKDLINFDKEKNAYIWFESEGDNPQKQYHAYHLVKEKTHEQDRKAINKIPDSIKDLLEYRQSL